MRPTCALTTTLLLVVLSWNACAFALDPSLDISQYAHTAWRVRDGFAKSGIATIAQTPDGYLWLGTQSGLLRFDGVRAFPWEPPAGERLPSKFISNLFVARDGTLWIGTLEGLASWREGKLTQYPEVAGGIVGRVIQDREGTIRFVLYDRGELCAIRRGKAECDVAQILGRLSVDLFEDRKGELWVTGSNEIWRWKPGPPQRFPFPRGVNRASQFLQMDDGTLLLSTNDGIKQILDGKIQSYAPPGVSGPFAAKNLLRSSDGCLWIGTHSGLLHMHHDRTDTFGAPDGLSSDEVSGGIFEDREGNIWVGTSGGLDRFRAYAIPTIGTNEGLSGNSSWAVEATADGSLWLASAKGLDRWQNGHVTVYTGQRAQGNDNAERASGGIRIRITDSGFTGPPQSFGLDDEGRLWASSFDGVFKFEDGRFAHIPRVPSGHINSIAQDTQGNVWISHVEQGLLEVTPDDAVRRTPWAQFGNRPFGARTMVADPTRGGLWLGFYGGGVAYFQDGQIRNSLSAIDGLGGGRVNHLRFGSLGGVWVATEGGLSRIKAGRIETLNSKNGLPCDEVHWSLEDNDHAIWVYTPCGLIRIEPSDWHAWASNPKHIVQTTLFDTSDGVRTVGVLGSFGPPVTKAPDGRIWFVPQDGVSVIDPHHLPFNAIPPPVHVEQITADRKTHDASSGWRLPPLVRNLEIDYTALSLVAPENNRFRYKLEGLDHDWQDAGNRRQAFYTNLPPHTYRFRVIACNNSGVWNETGDSFEFSIAPAYYQTVWFKLLCAAASLALLWALYLLRLQQLRHQFTIGLEARVNERTRVARELHDTLLQSFQGVAFQLQAARKLQLRKADNAGEVLDEAIQATEEAIQEGRSAIRDLRPEPAARRDLPELLNAVGRELAAAHEQNGHAPNYRVVVEGKQQDLSPMLQDEVYRISREVIRNAIAHAAASHIEVELRYDHDQLRVRVRDDGTGIESKVLAGGQSGHFGIPGMRERAQRIGARLDFWSELGAGTEVELTVPASMAYQELRNGRRFRLFRRAGNDE
jgi:signal transduction histidine kinase/ligand-binding sensor domain-containing protein